MELQQYAKALEDFEMSLTTCTEPKDKINIETSLAAAKNSFSLTNHTTSSKFERTRLSNPNLW
jgi:hypothetical protein